MPATARWIHIGVRPTTAPIDAERNARAFHHMKPWAMPRASTRSGRKLNANPASAPDAASASIRSRSVVCRARTPNTTLHNASATAPSQASADSPIGVSTSKVTVTAATVASRCPHGLVRA